MYLTIFIQRFVWNFLKEDEVPDKVLDGVDALLHYALKPLFRW